MKDIEVVFSTDIDYDSISRVLNYTKNNILFEPERKRCEKYMRSADKINFIIGRSVVRKKNVFFNKEFSYGEHGKPFITSSYFFNISHTDGAVAIAFTKVGGIGVDIEKMTKQNFNQMLPYFACGEEIEYINSDISSRQSRFYGVWTLKEAYLKSTGVGIISDLTELNTLVFDESRFKRKYINGLKGADFCLSVYSDVGDCSELSVSFNNISAEELLEPVFWKIQ